MTVHVSTAGLPTPGQGNTAKRVTELDRAIGARITAARHGAGLSQTTLGRAIGVTFQQVQKYEKGLNRVSAGKLVEIARVLGVDQADLLGTHEALAAAAPPLSRSAIGLAQAFDRIPESASKAQLRRLVLALAGDAAVPGAPSAGHA